MRDAGTRIRARNEVRVVPPGHARVHTAPRSRAIAHRTSLELIAHACGRRGPRLTDDITR